MRIFEIFESVQGETSRSGLPMLFIRTSACNLRCTWCDTTHAYHGGVEHSVAELVERAEQSGLRHVTLTGGEPLLQPDAPELLRLLLDRDFDVQIETNGSISIKGLDPRVRRIVDMKPPASGEAHRFLASNLDELTQNDELKFVLFDRSDYEWARDRVRRLSLESRCPVLFSPAWDQLAPADLVAWILEDRLPVRLNLQLHKIIWGPHVQGV